jgi:hypothetical protein
VKATDERKWKTRLVKGEYPDRQFDIDFWQRRVTASVFGDEAHLISPDDLIANKEASRRPSDLAHRDTIPRYLKG